VVLVTGRVLFGDSTMVERTPQLLEQAPEPFVELNRADAERLGIPNGAQVELSTARGSVRLRARVDRRVPEGTAYAPDNHHAAVLREILDWNEPMPIVRIAAC
jgi:formate dehydrogenase major subunit/formate dehydrogenase alpha subunit